MNIPKIRSGLEVCIYAGIASYASQLLTQRPVPEAIPELLTGGLMYGLIIQVFPHEKGQRLASIPAAMAGYTISMLMLQQYS